ncbi:MAG: ABC transporter ATP-binding protein [Firmicutes bacterium]|nr:ABC transporter ATP-binding protein [Bacillota bacterium]
MRLKQLIILGKGLYHYILLAIVLLIFSRITYSMIPLFTQYVLKRLLEQPGIGDTEVYNQVNLPEIFIRFFESANSFLNEILYVAIILMSLQVVRFLFRFIELSIRGFVRHTMGQNLRLKIYEHIQKLPYKFHNNTDSGDLIQRSTSDIETSVNFLSRTLMDMIFLLSTLVFGAYQLYVLNGTLTIILLTIIPFVGVASVWYFRKNDKMYHDVEEAESKMMTVIQENLSSARIVRAFGNEAYEIEKLRIKNDHHRDMRLRTGKIVSKFWGTMDFIGISQYVLVIGLGIYFMNQNQMDAAQIAAALGLVGMLIWPIRGLGHILNDYAKALAASKRIYEILNLETEYVKNGTMTPEIKGHLVFEHVSFKFDDTENILFKDLSFEILPGETVAFIGRTGSGKSTLMNMLMRMYEYQSGHIYLDGVELRDIEKTYLRSHLGVVLQEPFLFSKTVYDNIAIANRKADRSKIMMAAQAASLEKDIKTFQQGYDTLVGEKGTTLSGGQKQRVAIARILVSEKPVLIFDDALSAVDTQTDLLIREALSKMNKKQTTLIITHRMTTAKEADKIIVIDQGFVQAVGNHEVLSKQAGLYQELWKIQGKLEEDFLKTLEGGDEDAR